MADVQLEHGHLRIANLLLEALGVARLTGTETKIMIVLIRLTYGWRRRTVRITRKELAERCNVAFTGGFRRALEHLIDEGVITLVDDSHGRTAALYAINKDFENWGRLSVPVGTLNALYSERLESDDERLCVPPQGQSTATGEAEQTDPTGTPDENTAADKEPPEGPSDADKEPPQGTAPQGTAPQGQQSAPTGTPPIIRKTERHITTTTAADSATVYAIGLATAANAAITARWGEQPTVIGYHTGLDLAETLIAIGVDVEVARQAIATSIEKTKKSPRDGNLPTTLSYWHNPIIAAHHEAVQRAHNEADKHRSRGGGVQPIANVVDPGAAAERTRDDEALKDLHTAARRAAAEVWGRAHPSEAQSIKADVDVEYDGFGESRWTARAREVDFITRCAAKAGFVEDIDAWAAGQTAPAEAVS